ncbi:N-terminal nucleophile aminohydrolases (Ntn hydrolases) [Diplocarpon rosae]|nr:N-terminal nucleophile aminohydrolases (Ntn hydrolases) [Diplocarpon rosae]
MLTVDALVLSLVAQIVSAYPQPAAAPAPAAAAAAVPRLGAVASETDICSRIGIEVLERGGNAADAIVATQLCVGVTGMYHSGIGGGGFATVRSKRGEYEFIDFREAAPAAAFEDMFTPPCSNCAFSLFGGLASGIPGELRGLEYIHKHYGSLSWKELVMPAVNVARHGFRVNEDLMYYIGSETALQSSNGTMTLADLADYTVKIRPISNITYRGYKVHTGSAPSGGAIVSSILKIIEGYDMSRSASLNLSTHYLDEAFRFAYGQRTLLGDPDFLDIAAYQESMYSEATAAQIRDLIQPDRTLDVAAYNPAGYEVLTDSGTSASVASDRSGLTIALTSTINTRWGSRVMVPETGDILNNQMNDFSIPHTINDFGYIPTEANFIRPGKRPLSSIAPTIVEYPNGEVYISHAAAGGSQIITEVAQHLWRVLDQEMTTAEALAAARMHDQLSPNKVAFEAANPERGITGWDDQTTDFLSSLGSVVAHLDRAGTSGQGLRILPNGTFEAASEPRQLNSGGYAV